MTIRRAREILDQEIKHLSDKKVNELIDKSSVLLDVVLDMYERRSRRDRGTKPVFDTN